MATNFTVGKLLFVAVISYLGRNPSGYDGEGLETYHTSVDSSRGSRHDCSHFLTKQRQLKGTTDRLQSRITLLNKRPIWYSALSRSV
jgi:hypothetical protein